MRPAGFAFLTMVAANHLHPDLGGKVRPAVQRCVNERPQHLPLIPNVQPGAELLLSVMPVTALEQITHEARIQDAERDTDLAELPPPVLNLADRVLEAADGAFHPVPVRLADLNVSDRHDETGRVLRSCLRLPWFPLPNLRNQAV